MHVPKTAGSSARQGIIAALKPRSMLTGFDRSLFGVRIDLETLEATLRRTIYSCPREMPPDADLVMGHIARTTLCAAYPSHRIFTVLRDPRSRLISHWLFWRSHSDETLDPWGTWGERVKISRQPLRQFLTSPEIACQTDNLLVRMLLWPHAGIADDAFISPESDEVLLEAGRRALRSFDFVGTVEDPFLERRMGGFLGTKFVLPRVNETRSLSADLRPVLTDELDEMALAALDARCRLDAVLWSEIVQPHCLPATPQSVSERGLLRSLFRYVDTGVARLSGTPAEAEREQILLRAPVADGERRQAIAQASAAVAERDRAIGLASAAEAERDQALERAAAAVAERDQAFDRASAAEAERRQALERVAAMERSTSWRITGPLRTLVMSSGIRN
jgi:hypothetical protein